MLYDRAKIEVQAGAGGSGCVSFRREAHVPKGGPDGGDGGKGGDIVLVCDGSLRDLHALKRKPHRAAGRGGHGEGALRHGAAGEDLLIAVPPGTEALGEDGELAGRRYELLAAGQRVVLAKGGAGGRGNKRFATATRQAPRFAEEGVSGEQGTLQLQLKLLADVGLVGLPNAGKSSLLRRLTRAQPKVASYPFTTLEPVLGVLDDGERQLVIADIPGLIEGASAGAGLGHEFLAHVERCRLLVHVLDVSAAPDRSGSAIVDNYNTIEHELAAHHSRLARLPRIVVLSKADLVAPAQVQAAIGQCLTILGGNARVLATSSATGEGIKALSQSLLRSVPAGTRSDGYSLLRSDEGHAAPEGKRQAELAQHIVYRPHAGSGFTVARLGPHRFAVRGKGIERLTQRFDIENAEAMAYLESRLRRIGVIAALEAEGFERGDQIEIGELALELDPEP